MFLTIYPLPEGANLLQMFFALWVNFILQVVVAFAVVTYVIYIVFKKVVANSYYPHSAHNFAVSATMALWFGAAITFSLYFWIFVMSPTADMPFRLIPLLCIVAFLLLLGISVHRAWEFWKHNRSMSL